MNKLVSLAFAASLGAVAFGCGSDPAPPPVSPATATGPAAVAPAAPRADTTAPTSGSVHIDDRIVKACGDLPTAHFAFDSASVAGDAAAALDALARCFLSGPLTGKGMKVVGHADARGEVEYNLALGQQRAGSVAGYLGSKGLDKARIATSSKGEFDATGADEEGWARDRKVEIFLAD